LIAFSFGAIIEARRASDTLAIAGAVMVGLGFRPFKSAVLNLLANTAPVRLGRDRHADHHTRGRERTRSGHAFQQWRPQLPFVSVLVPSGWSRRS